MGRDADRASRQGFEVPTMNCPPAGKSSQITKAGLLGLTPVYWNRRQAPCRFGVQHFKIAENSVLGNLYKRSGHTAFPDAKKRLGPPLSSGPSLMKLMTEYQLGFSTPVDSLKSSAETNARPVKHSVQQQIGSWLISGHQPVNRLSAKPQ